MHLYNSTAEEGQVKGCPHVYCVNPMLGTQEQSVPGNCQKKKEKGRLVLREVSATEKVVTGGQPTSLYCC